jgi:outer membrane protein TolC
MTRFTILAVTALIIIPAIETSVWAAEPDVAAQIKALQKERVETLTKAANTRGSEYQVGTTPCEYVIRAEMDLVDAQLDTTDKPIERIAVLTVRAQRATDLLKVIDTTFRYGPGIEYDVCRLRSHLLTTRIRLLRAERIAAGDIKALQRKQVDAMAKAVDIRQSHYKVGTISGEWLVGAETDLVNAQLHATDKPDERTALLTEAVKRETQFLEIAQERFKQGTVMQSDVYLAKALLLVAKIGLLQEHGRQAAATAQIKALQKERVETLAKLVEFDLTEYKAGRMDGEDVIAAETDLIHAQLDATNKREERTALLSAAVKRATEFLKIADVKYQAGTVTQADDLRAKGLLLSARMELLREGPSR